MRFDPARPEPDWSLNRVRLIDLPEAALPDGQPPVDFRGRSAYQLVSTAALDQLLQDHAFLPELPADDRRQQFFTALDSGNNQQAEAIAQRIGAGLGLLLLALKRGDAVNRAARPEWDDAIWEHWSHMDQIILGGGMLRGRMGQILLASARAYTVNTSCQIAIAPHAPYLPLIGAARMVQDASSAAIFDFGGTRIKRALAHYQSGELATLEILPSLPAVTEQVSTPQQIFERMLHLLAEATTHTTAHIIPISVASYVDPHGQPLQAQHGIYMRLGQLHADLPAAFAQALRIRTGKRFQVRLLHDGSAAAQVYAPAKNSAVLMIGTALGIGFPVERTGLCPVSPSLSISGEHAG